MQNWSEWNLLYKYLADLIMVESNLLQSNLPSIEGLLIQMHKHFSWIEECLISMNHTGKARGLFQLDSCSIPLE